MRSDTLGIARYRFGQNMLMFWENWKSRRRRATVDKPGELGQDGGSIEPPHRRAATGGYRHDPAGSAHAVTPKNPGLTDYQASDPKSSQCGKGQWSSATPQHAETFDKKQRPNNILAALVQRWENKACQSASANELASEFCRSLQEYPDL